MKKRLISMFLLMSFVGMFILAGHPMQSFGEALGRGILQATTGSGNLQYWGGPILQSPQVYVTYWGWRSDPSGEAAYLEQFLDGLGGSRWLNTLTQYYEDNRGSISNPINQFKGSWYDNTNPIPSDPTMAQMAQEAAVSAAHFGYHQDAVYFIATPTGNLSQPSLGFCASHYVAMTSQGPIALVDFPYVTDFGRTCGRNWVNAGSAGLLDGVSIYASHEYAETITDPQTNSIAWSSNNTLKGEIGDLCESQGTQNITLSTGTFAVQPLWDNTFNHGNGGCVYAH